MFENWILLFVLSLSLSISLPSLSYTPPPSLWESQLKDCQGPNHRISMPFISTTLRGKPLLNAIRDYPSKQEQLKSIIDFYFSLSTKDCCPLTPCSPHILVWHGQSMHVNCSQIFCTFQLICLDQPKVCRYKTTMPRAALHTGILYPPHPNSSPALFLGATGCVYMLSTFGMFVCMHYLLIIDLHKCR